MMVQDFARLFVAAAFGLLAASAQANITDVRASSTGVITLRSSAQPPVTGTELNVYRSDSRGYGAGFDGTTLITPTSIFFENGTMAAGTKNRAKAVTDVSIDFFNSTGSAGLPGLQSVIFPASFGFYVGDFNACAGATLPSCAQVAGGPGFSGFKHNAFRAPGPEIAGVRFTFDVLSDGVVARSIGGSIKMLRDSTGAIKFVEDFGAGANALSAVLQNLRLNVVDDYSYVYSWDEGDFYTDFGSLLAAGATRTVTFRITTESWSNSQPLFGERFRNEIVAFSGFADPLGRGGGLRADAGSRFGALAPVSLAGIPGVMFEPYELGLPRYQNGIIVFTAPGTDEGGGGGDGGGGTGELRAGEMTAGVPEPATWTMLILGFGFIGAIARQRRPGAA